MYKLQTFTASLLLATTPTMLAYPQHTPPYTSQRVDYEEKRAEKDYVLSYDDMLLLLDEIESGELENRRTPEELERLKHFVAFLAKEGTLPDGSVESMSLDDDIEDLLDGENNIYKDAISFAASSEYQYLIVPAVLNGHGEIVLCKSWIKRKWDQVKKFVKKHKKKSLSEQLLSLQPLLWLWRLQQLPWRQPEQRQARQELLELLQGHPILIISQVKTIRLQSQLQPIFRQVWQLLKKLPC